MNAIRIRLARANVQIPAPIPLSLVALLVAASCALSQDDRRTLRTQGIGQLENERDADAEATFRKLVEVEPDDALPYANLAVALLRQQKFEEARTQLDRAFSMAPGRADLFAIEADLNEWSGDRDGALASYLRAAEEAPYDIELQYRLFRQADTMPNHPGAAAAKAQALERLTRLRPENLIVLTTVGVTALAEEDRAGATTAFTRLRDLLWQMSPGPQQVLARVLDALEEGDFRAASRAARGFGNVIKGEEIYQGNLTEIFTNIRGIPVQRFADEEPSGTFGDPLDIDFSATTLSDSGVRGSALLVADLLGSHEPEVVTISTRGDGFAFVVRSGPKLEVIQELASPGLTELFASDLDDDGIQDVVGLGADHDLVVWRGSAGGSFSDATEAMGLAGVKASVAGAFDFDDEGDLDLFVTPNDGVIDLFWNPGQPPFRRFGTESLPQLRPRAVAGMATSDLDRDGDIDIVLAHGEGLTWLDNQRQGRFANRTAFGGLRGVAAANHVTAKDLDADGFPDLVSASNGVELRLNERGIFGVPQSLTNVETTELELFDADNDGRLDLASVGPQGVALRAQSAESLTFRDLLIKDAPKGALTSVATGDADDDGDLDVFVGGPDGLYRLENQGGNENRWLSVRLVGLDVGNGKNNRFGRGSSLEVWADGGYQFHEVYGPDTHIGLGRNKEADNLRVVWRNGVPQNRIDASGNQRIVEEQVLKGSCPFLYTWNGEEITFVTDLLWGAPLGMPLAPGVWNGADPQELVRVDGAVPRNGFYDLRITEELWEAAFFDSVRLWVVDHPAETEVASNLRIIPGSAPIDDRVLGFTQLRSPRAAVDGRGRDVTSRVLERDEIYADGYAVGQYQGISTQPWALTFDLGVAPERPIRLVLDGWVFPADASLNLSIDQAVRAGDLEMVMTRLEALTEDGWVVVMDPMGFPPGKTKTMVVDTPALPVGASKLRIKTSRWLHWDRIAWTDDLRDDAGTDFDVVAKLEASVADLQVRGFSKMERTAPNGPHSFDYAKVSRISPWQPFAGNYTRLGDMRELLRTADDRNVILAPGDEMRVLFDATRLPEVAPGSVRTVFLESVGWDKDADRNTFEANTVEPLPFRAMSRYPYAEGESYPDSKELETYRQQWLTRRIEAPVGSESAPAGGR